MWRRVSVLLALAGALLLPASAGALGLDPIDTFISPVYVTSDPADPDRLFVVEKGGRIRLREDGQTSTFLDLTTMTPPPSTTGERGLLSMAFAADYETSGRFYVYYTEGGTVGSSTALGDLGDLRVDEFTADGDSVDLSTQRHLLTIEHSSQTNHNGGQLQLGPDGYLYVATGDGGAGGDPDGNGQNLNSLLGKLLRIDPSEGEPYAIPADNPYVGVEGADEIWSYGLRNPWRFSFDRLTGDLMIGDVGQGSREEIDYEPDDPNQSLSNAGRGDNFGWDCREGELAYTGPPGTPSPACPASGFTEPVFTYSHPAGCSITGGYVARDESLGDVFGRYVFVDLCAGNIGSVILGLPTATSPRLEGLSASSPSSFGEDACGRLYLAELGTGEVSRFTGDEPADCGAAPPEPEPEPEPLLTCDREEATIQAEPGEATVGTQGVDIIVGTVGPDLIRSFGGKDAVCGRGGNDMLLGQGAADTLKGGRGGDLLRGGRGSDHLAGGARRDRCVGGPGRDSKRSC